MCSVPGMRRRSGLAQSEASRSDRPVKTKLTRLANLPYSQRSSWARGPAHEPVHVTSRDRKLSTVVGVRREAMCLASWRQFRSVRTGWNQTAGPPPIDATESEHLSAARVTRCQSENGSWSRARARICSMGVRRHGLQKRSSIKAQHPVPKVGHYQNSVTRYELPSQAKQPTFHRSDTMKSHYCAQR